MRPMLERLDRWIHGFLPVSAEGLALSRIFFAAYFLLIGIPTFSWISANPPGFFSPPPLSLAAAFSTFPPEPLLLALDLAICVLLIFLLVGFKTKTTSIALSLAWIVGNSFRFSFGKIDHSIMAVITPAVMAFAGWGARYSIDARGTDNRAEVKAWPLTLLALFLGFGFFSAGLPKLLGWVDFDLSTQGARGWLVSGWHDLSRRRLLAPFFMRIHSPWFWEAMDLSAVAFEVGVLFTLARRTAFRAYLFVAMIFHLLNLLMLNIGFLTLMPVYVVFAPWERMSANGGRARMNGLASYRAMTVALAAFLPLYLLRGRISVDTAANAFSHLGIAADLNGAFDYNWIVTLVVIPAGALIAVALAGSATTAMKAERPAGAGGKRIIFFDGVCNLCNGYVDFLIRRDRRRRLMFASLQSEPGQALERKRRPTSGAGEIDSILLMEADGRVYERSDAVLKVVSALGGGYRLVAVFWIVPRLLRDLIYRLVARSRYRVFGRRDACRLPTAEERVSFL